MSHRRNLGVTSRRGGGDGGQQDAMPATPLRHTPSTLGMAASLARSASLALNRSHSVRTANGPATSPSSTPEAQAEFRRTLSKRLIDAKKKFEDDRAKEEDEVEAHQVQIYWQRRRQTIGDILRRTAQLETSSLPPLHEVTIEDPKERDLTATELSLAFSSLSDRSSARNTQDTSFTTFDGETLTSSAQTSFNSSEISVTNRPPAGHLSLLEKVEIFDPVLAENFCRVSAAAVRRATIHPFYDTSNSASATDAASSDESVHGSPFQSFMTIDGLPFESQVAHDYILEQLQRKWFQTRTSTQPKSEAVIVREALWELGEAVTDQWGVLGVTGWKELLTTPKKRSITISDHFAKPLEPEQYQSAWALAFLERAEERERAAIKAREEEDEQKEKEVEGEMYKKGKSEAIEKIVEACAKVDEDGKVVQTQLLLEAPGNPKQTANVQGGSTQKRAGPAAVMLKGFVARMGGST